MLQPAFADNEVTLDATAQAFFTGAEPWALALQSCFLKQTVVEKKKT
tara:strand:- start:322 stop:462 length:141 start_codon:yes stop_codon:yes gene_type:complete